MKLRRAIAATATVAALAGLGPIALLSVAAPAASADATAGGTPSAPSTDTPPADPPPPSDPSAGPADPAVTPPAPPPADPGTPSDDPSGETPTDPAAPGTGPGDPASGGPEAPKGTEAPDQGPDGATGEPGAHDTGEHTAGDPGEPGEPGAETQPGLGWSPGQCRDFKPDDALSVDVTGLPSKIVAGSGWHPFVFSVTNHTGEQLRNIYVQSFTEYATGVNENDSLQLDLARLQFKDPAGGRWTDAYQDFYEDGGEHHAYSGTFVALVPRLGHNAHVDLQLRVDVAAAAPPGAAFALSTAVYAGHGDTCNLNGDTYDFTVLKAGSRPTGVGDAKPTGEKPEPLHHDGSHPQGGVYARPVAGSLAATGTSEAVPVIGLIGALAVLIGSVTLYLARRRAAAQLYGTTDAEDAEDAEGTHGGPHEETTGSAGTAGSTGTSGDSHSAGATGTTGTAPAADEGDNAEDAGGTENAETAKHIGNTENTRSADNTDNTDDAGNGKNPGGSGIPGGHGPDRT